MKYILLNHVNNVIDFFWKTHILNSKLIQILNDSHTIQYNSKHLGELSYVHVASSRIFNKTKIKLITHISPEQ